MPKTDLYSYFKPDAYLLEKNDNMVQLAITGQKTGPPSRRISLHQTGLKIINAKIVRFDKHGPIEIEVIRINHLPTTQQVRLHGGAVMYPGRYQIDLSYKITPEKLAELGQASPNRELIPSIDQAEAWQTAKLDIK